MSMTIFPTGLTYSRNTKSPLVDGNIYGTLTEAQAYINDADKNAFVGQILSIINDGTNNGAYLVTQIAGQVIGKNEDDTNIIATSGKLERLQGSSSVDTIWTYDLPE